MTRSPSSQTPKTLKLKNGLMGDTEIEVSIDVRFALLRTVVGGLVESPSLRRDVLSALNINFSSIAVLRLQKKKKKKLCYF
jgi:hypothetical protein